MLGKLEFLALSASMSLEGEGHTTCQQTSLLGWKAAT